MTITYLYLENYSAYHIFSAFRVSAAGLISGFLWLDSVAGYCFDSSGGEEFYEGVVMGYLKKFNGVLFDEF